MFKALFKSTPSATPTDVAARVRSGEAVLIDVREANEWSRGVVETAVLLPFSDLTRRRTQWSPFLAQVAGRELLLYCASGSRSGIATRLLVSEGFRATNAGSITDWSAAGWRITQPRN
jgi:rhodanese-related sulfurtransferase